jgi:hypothetical protein
MDTLSICVICKKNLVRLCVFQWNKIWYPLRSLFTGNFLNVSRTYEQPVYSRTASELSVKKKNIYFMKSVDRDRVACARCYSTFMISDEDATIVLFIYRQRNTKLISRQHLQAWNFSFPNYFFFCLRMNFNVQLQKTYSQTITTLNKSGLSNHQNRVNTRRSPGKWITVALKQLSTRPDLKLKISE